MSKISEAFSHLARKACTGKSAPLPPTLLQTLVCEVLASGSHAEDAVVYAMARSMHGGYIAQLTEDPNDPGWVNRASGATEGFYPVDHCGAARRKLRGVGTAVRTFAPADFLRRDPTGTLDERALRFEEALLELIRSRIDA